MRKRKKHKPDITKTIAFRKFYALRQKAISKSYAAQQRAAAKEAASYAASRSRKRKG